MAARWPQRPFPYRGSCFWKCSLILFLLETASKGKIIDFPCVFTCFGAILGHFWGQETACIDPFPIGVGLPTLSVSGSYLSVSRLQKSSVATLGHLVDFLGAKMVHDGLKVANDGFKLAKEDSNMAQDALSCLQDGSEMLRHRLLVPSWAISGSSCGQFEANLAPLWAIVGSSCTSQAKISIFHWCFNDFKVNPGPSWGHLGASSGPTWRHLGPCRGQGALHKQNINFPSGF